MVLQDFLFFSSGGTLFSGAKPIVNFGKRSSKEHSREIILKSAYWPRRRCCLKGFSIFSSAGHFVQRSGTILAILEEGHPRKNSMKLF